jgi:hypothetical protein
MRNVDRKKLLGHSLRDLLIFFKPLFFELFPQRRNTGGFPDAVDAVEELGILFKFKLPNTIHTVQELWGVLLTNTIHTVEELGILFKFKLPNTIHTVQELWRVLLINSVLLILLLLLIKFGLRGRGTMGNFVDKYDSRGRGTGGFV